MLNGAGGVPKYKVLGGEEKKLQRFISILVPSNSFQEHMVGDDSHLPYLGQLGMLEINEGEEVLIDSEDLTSCFNLFALPHEWGGLLAFSKQVKSSVFGGSPDSMSWVAMSVVPMGWLNSVSLMQTVVRNLVFGLSRIPFSSEISKQKPFPTDKSASLVYLDSYDELRKVQAGCREVLEGEKSERHARFEDTCRRLGLALNDGKRLVGSVVGSLQGGELDGRKGTFRASKDKLESLVGYGLVLISSEEVSEFELRHFVGKALFVMAFRRASFCYLESVFKDIEKLRKSRRRGPLTNQTKDEILTILLLVPLLRMNLRAELDGEVAITDASPLGAGGGVATEFKRLPDQVMHGGGNCYECGVDPLPDQFPCPAVCGVALCSLECIAAHRAGSCVRKKYPVPKFGERFAGKNAPLTHAVARVGGIEVQRPYDWHYGDDYFSDEGRNALESMERDPNLVAEHFAPCCKLFSKARGKPIRLASGRWIQGPQPVRDEKHLMGYPWLGKEMKQRLRHSNSMALKSIKRLETANADRRLATLEHPYSSWLWYLRPVQGLNEQGHAYAEGSVCCFGGRREKWFALLGNSEGVRARLHQPNCPGHDDLLPYEVHEDDDGNLSYDTELEAEYPRRWCEAYAQGLREELEARGYLQSAVVKGRRKWIIEELQQSTDRLKEGMTATMMAGAIEEIEREMSPGMEEAHLKEMLRRLAIRGTDLRLHLSDGVPELPYPAYRWYFKKVFSYKWKYEAHINVYELNAFISMVERRAGMASKHSMRYLSLVDSMVVRGAVAKGRSSSPSMNWGLKKANALILASDAFPLLGWTISRWNWADTPSRVFE